MAKRNLLAALLIGLLAACASMPRASTEAQIRELEQRQVTAAIARDRATLERLFAPDFRLVNPSGAIAGKQELLQLLTEGIAHLLAIADRVGTDLLRLGHHDLRVTIELGLNSGDDRPLECLVLACHCRP